MRIAAMSDKLKFLVALTQSPDRTKAATESGVALTQVLKWLAEDVDFAKEIVEIEEGNPRLDLLYSLRVRELQEVMRLVGTKRIEVRA